MFLELSLSTLRLVATFAVCALLVHGLYQVYCPPANSRRLTQGCANGFRRCGRCLLGA
jgi:hypothetical protein